MGSSAGIIAYMVHKLGGASRLEEIYIWLVLGTLVAAIKLAKEEKLPNQDATDMKSLSTPIWGINT